MFNAVRLAKSTLKFLALKRTRFAHHQYPPMTTWHIRKLDETGKHSGGGITTASLCGNVKPLPDGLGGWDVIVDITPHHVAHNCQRCGELFQAEVVGRTFDPSDFNLDAISDTIGDDD